MGDMRYLSLCKYLVISAMLLVFAVIQCSAQDGEPSAKITPPPSSQITELQKQLIEAQKANEEAQAEYYQTQTDKLKQTPTPTPEPTTKTIRQNIAENPASVLGALVALIAAVITGITFIVNYRFNTETQKNTQFYEALKRFGDKDSPVIRSSAAALLGQIGLTETGFFKRKKPYLVTATDQLLSGISLEDDGVVLNSIENALQLLLSAAQNPYEYYEKLIRLNRGLQVELLNALADAQAIWTPIYADSPDDKNPEDNLKLIEIDEVIRADHSNLAISITGFDKIILEAFRYRYFFEFPKRVTLTRNIAVQRYDFMENDSWSEYQNEIIKSLRTAAGRLRVNSDILSLVINLIYKKMSLPPTKQELSKYVDLSNLFLIRKDIVIHGTRVSLSRSQLQFVYFENCYLKDSRFIGTHLENARFFQTDLEESSFNEAHLENSWLSFTNLNNTEFKNTHLKKAAFFNSSLTNAKMAGAIIDNETRFSGSNWWEADFYFEDEPEKKDEALLEHLYKQYSQDIPDDLTKTHESVREFVTKKRNEAQSELIKTDNDKEIGQSNEEDG